MISRITSQAFFEELCSIAKEKNIEKLNLICKEISMDLRDSLCLLSPAGELARRGDKESAHWLLSQGATPHLIGMGAAMGNDLNLAEEMRSTHGASVHFIAKGAAIYGNFDYAMYLHEHHGAHIIMIAEGAAIGKHHVKVEKIRKKYLNEFSRHQILPVVLDNNDEQNILLFIARGAILGGNWEYAENLRADNPGIVNVHELAFAASLANNVSYAEYLRNQHGADIKYCLIGALLGVHEDYFEFLTKIKKINESSIKITLAFRGFIKPYSLMTLNEFHIGGGDLIQGLVLGGHNKFLVDFIQSRCSEYLFSNIAKAVMRQFACANVFGDLKYSEYLYKEVDWIAVKERRQMVIDYFFESLHYILSHIYFQNETSTLHQLSLIDNHDFLNDIKLGASNILSQLEAFQKKYGYELVLKEKRFSTACKNIANCIPYAIKINETRKKYNLDHDSAKTFLEKRDLRQIIFTLIFSLKMDVIPADITMLIVMNFSPLNYFQTKNLYDQVSFFHKKNFFINDLNKYCQSFWMNQFSKGKSLLSSFGATNDDNSPNKNFSNLNKYYQSFFNNNLDKAKQMIKDSSKTESITELRDLIKHVQASAENDVQDEFNDVINHHAKRF